MLSELTGAGCCGRWLVALLTFAWLQSRRQTSGRGTACELRSTDLLSASFFKSALETHLFQTHGVRSTELKLP